MFTTEEQVRLFTGKEVDSELIMRAQTVLEVVMGKVEAEIDSPNDLAVMARATAFQAVYMINNYDKVYEQMAVLSVAQTDSSIRLDEKKLSPWVAPLAFQAMTKLSWLRSRSIGTGAIYGKPVQSDWRTD